jgi:hypothetical protein
MNEWRESSTMPMDTHWDCGLSQKVVEFGVLSLAGRNAVQTAAPETGCGLIQGTTAGNRGDRQESTRNKGMNTARIVSMVFEIVMRLGAFAGQTKWTPP